eukprot:3460095-Alexandrium_andersonii.AAC.1
MLCDFSVDVSANLEPGVAEMRLQEHTDTHNVEHAENDGARGYREQVFARYMSQWPTPVTSQVHRACLYTMKRVTSDAEL